MQQKINFDDLINKQENAFTLAEVLITMSIIGVVAALTIPSVIVKTQQQEFRTAAKKAHSVLEQAVRLTELEEGPIGEWDWNDEVRPRRFAQTLEKNLNIIKTEDVNNYHRVFYTADGFRWHYDPTYPTSFGVDVNGDKGPSKFGDEYSTLAEWEDWEDLSNPDWPNVKLSDVFKIRFTDGKSTLKPNSNGYRDWIY